ncbi:MAG: hypothetical protein EOP10_15975 [Proteobacteria bacterium]|nr:MAG: hypothetical protein EOP10_15975 [Pseudomonadota bacterium]
MDEKERDLYRKLPLEDVFEAIADFGPGEQPRSHREVLTRFYPDYPVLPIEFLKDDPAAIEEAFAEKPIHHFLSSGTTARDRSRSSFSVKGLKDYRDLSIKSFLAVLARFFPNPTHVPGLSMIPDTKEWPTSSLAQMIAWIDEEMPVNYWHDKLEAPSEPVWLFATGFHIVAFADEGGYFPLPPGSIVIETGGTKGKTRSVTRDETYTLIQKCFGVDKNHIVSEYGMCELASQAYDFVENPKGPDVPLHDRWFRFPAWAQTRILDAEQTIRKEGDGSLVIDDRARSDMKTPFRTEDRVTLKGDGSFQLQGRVAFSPLKGCSLLAEDILKNQNELLRNEKPRAGTYTKISDDELKLRAEKIHGLAQTMVKDPKFHKLVHKSLLLEKPVEWWIQDLKASVPQSVDEWIKAAHASQNQSPSWLIIPPRTHDFALMHPLFLASVLNLDVVVRETKETELLRYYQDLFEGYWTFSIVSSDWRLEEGTVLPAQSILVFGSDETIEILKDATSHPVQGFGSWITLSAIHVSTWDQDVWVKDAFSLRQEGCMSSRLLIVWDEETPKHLEPKTVKLGDLTQGEQLHLAHSELDLALHGFEVFKRSSTHDIVLAHKKYTPGETIEDLLSSRPLTLPIVRANRSALRELFEQITKNPSLKLLSVDKPTRVAAEPLKSVILRDIGRANEAPWTGWHGTDPLFFPED